MHNPNVIVHFRPGAKPREWGSADTQIRPRVVKRGVDDIDDIDFGERIKYDMPDRINHLLPVSLDSISYLAVKLFLFILIL